MSSAKEQGKRPEAAEEAFDQAPDGLGAIPGRHRAARRRAAHRGRSLRGRDPGAEGARQHAAAALARRTLDPPAHFAQLQIRRLSEALLVCTSAMSRGNLQAVDRVVKIVRELDRYHGFGPAAAAPRLTAPALPAPDSPAQLLAPPLALAPPRCEPALAPPQAEEAAGDGASVG